MSNISCNDTFEKPCACAECLVKIERANDYFGNFVLHQLRTVWSRDGESGPADINQVFQQIEAAYQLMKRYIRTLTKRHNAERAASIYHQSPVATYSLNVSTQTETTDAIHPDEDLQSIDESNVDIDWILSEIQRINNSSAHSPLPTLPSPPSDNLNVHEDERATEPLNVSMTPHRESAHCSSELLPTNEPNASVPAQIIVKRLKCHVADCKRSFPLLKSLQVHLRSRHGIEKYLCHVRRCKASFAKVHQMVAHRQSAHSKLRWWPCGACKKQFRTYRRLHVHYQYLHEKGRFACSSDGCPFVASNRSKVKSHSQMEHILPTRPCPYAGCARAFKFPYLLAKHQLTHGYRQCKK